MFLFGKRYFSGLDIGTGSVKLVQIRDSKESEFDYFVKNIQYTDKDDPTVDQIKEVLKELIKDAKKLGDSVIVGIQGLSIFIRYIEIPRITQKEMEVALPIEARKYIPFPLEEMRLTYNNVAALSRDDRKMGVTFVAIPRSQITRFEKFFQEYNIKVKDYEPPALALSRGFKVTKYYRRGETVLIINIGTKYTTVSICRDGSVYFGRDFQVGGRDITKALIGGDASDYSKAEVKKRTTDLFSKMDLFLNISSVFEEWMREINDSIDYFKNYLIDSPQEIDRVVLTGGGAMQSGLTGFISRKLEKPTVVDSFFPGKVEVPEKDKELPRFSPLLKVAYGLALRAQEESS